MWRRLEDHEEIVPVAAGVCLTIPLGTHFQFRAFGHEPLAAIGVTMPPWPGEGEAVVVAGPWQPTFSELPSADGMRSGLQPAPDRTPAADTASAPGATSEPS